MADLKDSLSQKERRSRTVAFVVGLAIILVLIFLIVQVNNGDNTATDDQNGEAETSQVEEGAGSDATGQEEATGEQSEGEGANDGDVAVTDGEGAANDGTATTDGDADQQGTEEGSDGKSVEELPATGPAETAMGAMIVALATISYLESRRQLKAYARN